MGQMVPVVWWLGWVQEMGVARCVLLVLCAGVECPV